jgi:limonene-1,2-epoxide hydrolase
VTIGVTAEIKLEDLFASIDQMDAERFVSFIAEEGTFRFGSAPPVTGHEAIREAVSGFFGSIAGLRHRLLRVIGDGSELAVEGEVTYTRHDGSQITLPFANIFEVAEGRIVTYSIYVDIAPLYAA